MHKVAPQRERISPITRRAPLHQLRGRAPAVYAFLSAHPDGEVSAAEIADEIGCSERTVFRAFAVLTLAGLMMSTGRQGPTRSIITSRRVVRPLRPLARCHTPMTPVTELKSLSGSVVSEISEQQHAATPPSTARDPSPAAAALNPDTQSGESSRVMQREGRVIDSPSLSALAGDASESGPRETAERAGHQRPAETRPRCPNSAALEHGVGPTALAPPASVWTLPAPRETGETKPARGDHAAHPHSRDGGLHAAPGTLPSELVRALSALPEGLSAVSLIERSPLTPAEREGAARRILGRQPRNAGAFARACAIPDALADREARLMRDAEREAEQAWRAAIPEDLPELAPKVLDKPKPRAVPPPLPPREPRPINHATLRKVLALIPEESRRCLEFPRTT